MHSATNDKQHLQVDHALEQPPLSGKSSTSFHFPLHNVTYMIDKTSVVEQIYDDYLPVNMVLEEEIVVVSLDQNTNSSIIPIESSRKQILPTVHRCSSLQKEIDLVAHLLIQGKNVDVPFTSYLSKA